MMSGSKLVLLCVLTFVIAIQFSVQVEADVWFGIPCKYTGNYDKDNSQCGPDNNNILCAKSSTCDCADKWTTDDPAFMAKQKDLAAKPLAAAADKGSCA